MKSRTSIKDHHGPSLPIAIGVRRQTALVPTESNRDRFLRRPEVQRQTGLSRSSLYRLISQDLFPRPIGLSAKTVGWLQSQVDHWMASRVAAARQSQEG